VLYTTPSGYSDSYTHRSNLTHIVAFLGVPFLGPEIISRTFIFRRTLLGNTIRDEILGFVE
jgi:hypothetical protein